MANGWHEDREDRLDSLVLHGMPVHIEAATIVDEFVSIEVNVDESLLPRTAEARGFNLHLTLGFESDYGVGIAREAVARINERWQGRVMVLRVAKWTNGGTVELAWYDDLALDEDIAWLHDRGHYWERKLHVSL